MEKPPRTLRPWESMMHKIQKEEAAITYQKRQRNWALFIMGVNCAVLGLGLAAWRVLAREHLSFHNELRDIVGALMYSKIFLSFIAAFASLILFHFVDFAFVGDKLSPYFTVVKARFDRVKIQFLTPATTWIKQNVLSPDAATATAIAKPFTASVEPAVQARNTQEEVTRRLNGALATPKKTFASPHQTPLPPSPQVGESTPTAKGIGHTPTRQLLQNISPGILQAESSRNSPYKGSPLRGSLHDKTALIDSVAVPDYMFKQLSQVLQDDSKRQQPNQLDSTASHFCSPVRSGATGLTAYSPFTPQVVSSPHSGGQSGVWMSPGPSSMSRYQPASLASPSALAPPIISNEDIDGDERAYRMYKRLQVYDCIDEWSERVRQWFSSRLLPDLIDEHDKNTARLTRLLRLLGYSLDETPVVSYDMHRNLQSPLRVDSQSGAALGGLSTLESSSGLSKTSNSVNLSLLLFSEGSLDANFLMKIKQLSMHGDFDREFREAVTARRRIERFFMLDRYYKQRPYVVERLRDLCASGGLAGYQASGGSKWRNQAWDSSLPTDAHILSHVFFCFMDSLLLPAQSFFQDFVISYPREPALRRGSKTVAFHQCKPDSQPPHFQIVSEDEIWEVVKGRNNLFHAMCLFLFHIKTKMGGFCGPINLAEPPLCLLSHIEPC
eukprot:GILJ01014108.1.p1 GENE.GILJ01014108.1~~GILJ01014108.1.p1  ORF type:complete len:667 (+),score=78.94 GILJ01014108.1:56-2056(+)